MERQVSRSDPAFFCRHAEIDSASYDQACCTASGAYTTLWCVLNMDGNGIPVRYLGLLQGQYTQKKKVAQLSNLHNITPHFKHPDRTSAY